MLSQRAAAEKVIDYIEQNMEKEINLDNIAQAIGYSKFHLNRIFMKETGHTIYKYLQARRLTAAAEKLVKTQRPIVQIAYEAGYSSQQAFTQAFKQSYCYPPKLYRARGIFEPKQNKITLRLYTSAPKCQGPRCLRAVMAA
mgnify:CR=1 FL=1